MFEISFGHCKLNKTEKRNLRFFKNSRNDFLWEQIFSKGAMLLGFRRFYSSFRRSESHKMQAVFFFVFGRQKGDPRRS